MKIAPNNPPTNQLNPGINEKQILNAISRSGYPLQTQIANILRPKFSVTEEWVYNDPDSNELRAMDILATLHIWKSDKSDSSSRIYPYVDLLIECKKSELPYVFFLCPKQHWLPDFPVYAGLRSDNINVITDDSVSSWTIRVNEALGLDNYLFLHNPECCNLFVKCVRKGKGLDFSGSESFHGLIMPLLKAMQQLKIAYYPIETAAYFHFHMILGIGVIDAPMIAVDASSKTPKLTAVPWLRLIRNELDAPSYGIDSSRMFAIDIVHKDFFKEYLDKNLLPFSKEFFKFAKKHQIELISGKGFAPKMEKYWCTNLEPRLHPRKRKNTAMRINRSLRNLLELIMRKRSRYD